MHSRVMLPSHRSVEYVLASSIPLSSTVAHLKLVCDRERKNRPSSSCMLCSHPFVCRVEGGEVWAVEMQLAMLNSRIQGSTRLPHSDIFV